MAKGKHAPAPGAVRKDKVVHPNSRQANKMKAKAQKRTKIQNKASVGGQRLQALGEKLCWFRDNLDICLDGDEVATVKTLKSLAEAYLSRFQEELDEIGMIKDISQSRKKRHASRLDVIEGVIKVEAGDYDSCGLEMPDLLDPKNFEYFRSWNGELRFVQNIKLRRFRRSWIEGQDNQRQDVKDGSAEMDMS